MTGGRARTFQTGADLRRTRRATTVTLGALVIIGGYLQIVLGLENDPGPRTTVLIVLTVVSVALAVAVVPLLLRSSDGVQARRPLMLILLATVLLTWSLALIPPFAGWGWGFLLAIAGGMFSCTVSRWPRALSLIGTLAVLAIGGLSDSFGTSGGASAAAPGEPGALVVIGTLVMITFIPLSTVWVLHVVLRIDDARETASELAVATERLRFASDLHDIQGHHLQVIALKGELAERRLLAGEVALAAAELSDIRRIAQTALEDTRAVVNDYRTVTVAVEARNAAAVLQSAGIDCTARIEVPELPTDLGAVFAVAIREAATNILRHSAATTATLELIRPTRDGYRLTVTNNGSHAGRTGGTGIDGLRNRVAAWNGTVDTDRRGDTFALIVSVPVPLPDAQKEER